MNMIKIEPLLNPGKAGVAWLASLVVSYLVVVASRYAYHPWGEIALSAFAAGHGCLACLLARGRLLDDAPIGRRWIDVATVVGAQWIGPLWWYYEWRKSSTGCRNSRLARPHSARNGWVFVILLMALVGGLMIWKFYVAVVP